MTPTATRRVPLAFIASGVATALCTGACAPMPSTEDAGPQVCAQGCYPLKQTDGGLDTLEDGGVICLC